MTRQSLLSVAIGFRMLRNNPLRTGLSTLGVVIGVAALVAVLALGDGLERYARDEIRNNSSVLVVELRPITTREVDGIQIPDTGAPLLTAQHAAALGALPGVAVTSMYTAAPSIATHGAMRHATIVRGSLASIAARDSLRVAHGRFYTEEEVLTGARVAVLSAPLAAALTGSAPPAALVGDTIALQGREVSVIGVLGARPPAAGTRQVTERAMAYMPISIATDYQILAGPPQRPSILLTARELEDVGPLRSGVGQWIAAHQPGWAGRVEVRTDEARGRKANQGILVFKLLMGAMTAISLLVGGIGIMNVLLASVVERTREIGIRKATGARQRDILVQFLSESVAISGVGSAIGAVLGFLGAVAVTAIMRRLALSPVHAGFSVSTFLVAASAAVLVGLVFGTYPALKAARMSPVEAMHTE